MKKRILSAFMALALCLTLLPAPARATETENNIAAQANTANVAEVTIDGTTMQYADIDAAFAAAQQAGSATVKLLADVTISHDDYSGIALEKGNITLDLNGKTLSKSTGDDSSFFARNTVFWLSPPGATTNDEFLAALKTPVRLTVQDSSADGNGKIVQPNGGPAVIATLNTILTVNGGTIENASSVDLDDDSHMKPNCAVLLSGGGKAVINGGTLSGMRGVAVTGYITKETEGLYKDNFGIDGYNNDTYGNELTVTGGNICGTSGEALIVYEKAKKIELSGGTFTTQSSAHSIWVADTVDGEQTFKGDASSLLASGCRYENNGTECVYSEDGKGVKGNATVAPRGGKVNGTPREDGFDITVASEVMAIFCLATSISDLKERLSKIVCAYTYDGKPVTAGEIGAAGAMTALLKDALDPNLVQTLENNPAIIHGGPFANIAHGCNSVLATKLSLSLADYTITEAGFGADLGAEKFLDIKCRYAGIAPSACVLVATVRALKSHGGVAKADLSQPNLEAVKAGASNLIRHIDNLKNGFGLPVVVAINAFPTDTAEEQAYVEQVCAEQGVPCVLSEVFAKGGEGGKALAEKVLEVLEDRPIQYTYPLEMPLKDKINAIATKIYRADGVNYSAAASKTLAELTEMGYGNLPVCIAKTQYSFSDNAKLTGAPTGFTMEVREVRLAAGAGFVVVICGNIMTMPGLPKKPAAVGIDVDADGKITGLF